MLTTEKKKRFLGFRWGFGRFFHFILISVYPKLKYLSKHLSSDEASTSKMRRITGVPLVYSRSNKADFVAANAITRVGGRAESH